MVRDTKSLSIISKIILSVTRPTKKICLVPRVSCDECLILKEIKVYYTKLEIRIIFRLFVDIDTEQK